MIRKRDGKFRATDRTSESDALAQLRAIEVSKEQSGK